MSSRNKYKNIIDPGTGGSKMQCTDSSYDHKISKISEANESRE